MRELCSAEPRGAGGGKEGRRERNGGRNGERPDRRVCASAGDVGDSESPQLACAAWGSAMDQALKGLSAKKGRGRDIGGGGREQCSRHAGRSCARVMYAVQCGKGACRQQGAGTSIQKLCEGVKKLQTGERKSRRDWREGVGRMDGRRNYVQLFSLQYCINKFCTKMLHHL